MLQEYEEFAPKVDEVNDLGNSFEAMTNNGERPTSPIRRLGRKLKKFISFYILALDFHFPNQQHDSEIDCKQR